MSTASRAFAIPELLEIILLYLSPQNLIKIRSTSKAFNTTIEGSTLLQQRLFYQQRILTHPANPHQRLWENPFIHRALKRFAKVALETLSADICSRHNSNKMKPHRTPYCLSIQIVEFAEEILLWLEMRGNLERGSWHDMYVTSEPCEVAIETKAADVDDVHLPLDVKMDELVDVMRRLYREGSI